MLETFALAGAPAARGRRGPARRRPPDRRAADVRRGAGLPRRHDAGAGGGRARCGRRGRDRRQLRRRADRPASTRWRDGRSGGGAGALDHARTPGLPQRVEGQFVYAAGPAYFGRSCAAIRRGRAPRSSAAAAARRPSTSRPCGPRSTRSAAAAGAVAEPTPPRARPSTAARRGRRRAAREPPTRGAAATRLAGRWPAAGSSSRVEIDPPRSVRIERTIEAARLLQAPASTSSTSATRPWPACGWAPWRSRSAIQHDLDLECIVHFTTRDRNLMALESELLGAHALGIRNILALTGDPPRIGDYPTGTGVWDVDSIGLIGILARLNRGEDAAGQPDRRSRPGSRSRGPRPDRGDAATEWDRLERKVEAGAHLVMTQPLYDLAQVRRCSARRAGGSGRRGFPVPVLLGVLPLQARATPSSCTTRCRASRFPTRCGRDARGGRARRRGRPGDGRRPARRRSTAWSPGTYIMPSFGRYEQAAELVRRHPRARHAAAWPGRQRAWSVGCSALAGALLWTVLPSPARRARRPVRRSRDRSTGGRLRLRRHLQCGRRSQQAEATIDAIEAADRRRGRRLHPARRLLRDRRPRRPSARARALIDQWGIGRAGFNDGLVIFFDLDPTTRARPGPAVRRARVRGRVPDATASARRSSTNDMLPLLRGGDFDGALARRAREGRCGRDARARRPAPAGPPGQRGHRARRAPRSCSSALAGWAVFNWRRFGKDPVYLDDPSILMPAPPPDLTAASGAMVMDGEHVAAGADDGDARPREPRPDRVPGGEPASSASARRSASTIEPAAGDAVVEAQRARNARRPTGPAEEVALREAPRARREEDGAYIAPDDTAQVRHVRRASSTRRSRATSSGSGWFKREAEQGRRSLGRVAASLAIVAGVVALFVGLNIPIVRADPHRRGGDRRRDRRGHPVAQAMPAVTMPGAMIRAMLAAYRRTLEKTMAQARSMQQVVDEAGLAWLDTPDQAVVWGTALGLQARDRGGPQAQPRGRQGTASRLPRRTSPPGTELRGARRSHRARRSGSGGSLFSDSGIPDIGGMMSALGTIGNSPSLVGAAVAGGSAAGRPVVAVAGAGGGF